jgi:MFS family permease
MSFPLPGRILPLAPGTFRALRHRDFRLLWIGLLVSLTGSWMQSVAQGWLVLHLSDSAFQLGLVGFCQFLPVLLLALPAGVAADRLPRRVTLLWTQAAAMVFALVLAVLTWLDVIRVWHVALLALAAGAAGALDIPVRQSLLQDLVGREDLPNAIALNSLAFNASRMIGPAIGGTLLAFTGEATVFFANGLSYLAVLAAILAMRHRPRVGPAERVSWVGEIKTGLAYAAREPRTRTVLSLVFVTSVFGAPYTVLLPVFARDVHGLDSTGLGWMMGATGLGAVIGALLIAGRGGRLRAGRTVATAMLLLGLGLVGFAVTRHLAAALALLVVIGGAMIVQMATSNTMLQLLSPPELRGRIISLYMLAFLGSAPLGSLLAGALASALNTPRAVMIGGVVCVGSAVWFASRIPALREAALRFDSQTVSTVQRSNDS